jgi:hypothetical protein
MDLDYDDDAAALAHAQQTDNLLIYDRSHLDPVDTLVWNCENLTVQQEDDDEDDELDIDQNNDDTYDDYNYDTYDNGDSYDDTDMFCVCGMPMDECIRRCAKVFIHDEEVFAEDCYEIVQQY